MTAFFKRASAAVITVATFGMPLTTLAQEDTSYGLRDEHWSSRRVISSFIKTGGTSTSFDNESLGQSGFDFAAMFSHPCYNPVGMHVIESCDRRFGVYGNLQAALHSTAMRNALVLKFGSGILDVLGSANANFEHSEAEDAAEAAEAAAESDVVRFYGNFRARRVQLWDICQERFTDPRACYQDNLRLLFQDKVEISGNVNH